MAPNMIVAAMAAAVTIAHVAAPAPRLEMIAAPGFTHAIPGRWTPPGAPGAIPIGGLGTGSIEIAGGGRIVGWRRSCDPRDTGITDGFTLSVQHGTQTTQILGTRPGKMRLFGHFPIADIESPVSDQSPLAVSARVLAPFIPNDTAAANTPVAIIVVRIHSRLDRATRVTLHLRFPGPVQDLHDFADGPMSGIAWRDGSGTLAAGVRSDVWRTTAAAAESPALSATGSIEPQSEATVPMVVAWHRPSWPGASGKLRMNRYASRYVDAEAAARWALADPLRLERRVVAWQTTVYDRSLPDWLQDCLVNSLCCLVRNAVWLDTGRFALREEVRAGASAETVQVRSAGGLALALLFPEVEKRCLQQQARVLTDSGLVPVAATAEGEPIHRPDGAMSPTATAQFVLGWRRYRLATGDQAALVSAYPAIRQALRSLMGTARGDGVGPETATDSPPSGSWYEAWPLVGVTLRSSQLQLAALLAGRTIADAQSDSATASECERAARAARAAIEELLWTGRYFRAANNADGTMMRDSCLASQAPAWVLARLLGLPEALATESVDAACRYALDACAGPASGGLVTAVGPDGTPDKDGGAQSRDVSPLESTEATTALVYLAHRTGGAPRDKDALARLERMWLAVRAAGQAWDMAGALDAGSLTTVWAPSHLGGVAAWALPFAVADKPIASRP